MTTTPIDAVLNAPVKFTERPSPLPADLRIEWRVAFLLCVLKMTCRGGKSSLPRLQVINWAARSADTRKRFLEIVTQGTKAGEIIIRVEPGLNYAIAFAAAEKFIERPGGDRIQLTDEGKKMVAQIQAAKDCLVEEKAFLTSLGMALTEQLAKKLLARG